MCQTFISRSYQQKYKCEGEIATMLQVVSIDPKITLSAEGRALLQKYCIAPISYSNYYPGESPLAYQTEFHGKKIWVMPKSEVKYPRDLICAAHQAGERNRYMRVWSGSSQRPEDVKFAITPSTPYQVIVSGHSGGSAITTQYFWVTFQVVDSELQILDIHQLTDHENLGFMFIWSPITSVTATNSEPV